MAAIENICDKLLTTYHRPPTPSLKFNMAAATERSDNGEESNMAAKKNRRKNTKPRSLRMQEEEFVPIKLEQVGLDDVNQAEQINTVTENIDENRNEIDEEKLERDEEMTSSHHDEISSLPTADTDSFVDCKNEYDDDDCFTNDLSEDDVAMATDDSYYGNDAYLDADDFPSPDDQTAENDSDSDEVLPQDSVPIDLSVKKEPPPLSAAHSNGSNVATKSDDLKDYAESAMNELLRMYGLKESCDGRRLPPDFLKHQTMKSFFLPKKSPSTSQLLDNGPTERSGLADIIGAPPALIPLNKVASESSAKTPNADGKRDVSSNCSADQTAPGRVTKHCRFLAERASTHELDVNGLPPDYAKYVKRFDSFEDCKSPMCQDMHYREHFHCMDCNFRVFVKKEEMIRHYKWHRKRDESLQHGFLRFSPVDDCQDGGRFEPCVHNQKQTHYHCIQSGCNKVYVSTSDVQMHSNYHRKASAIIQEGFQRFRATEDCGTLQCQFYNQRTTHFHCRRLTCNFTFKNKADMEKHKTYHQKDEILAKDGFKKFMKYEHCTFIGCRYSKQSNHIHCIRPGCMYVLHSTGQLYSHKRKHERREFEFGMRRLNEDSLSADSPRMSHFSAPPVSSAHSATSVGFMYETNPSPSSSSPRDSPQPIRNEPDLNSSLNLPITTFAHERTPLVGRTSANEDMVAEGTTANEDNGEDIPTMDEFLGRHVPPIMEKPERDESWKKYLTRFTANDPCVARCPQLYKDHYHCNIRNCNVLFRTKERVREHGRLHDQEDRITFLTYRTVCESDQCYMDSCTANGTKHYHCLWPDCTTVITSQSAALSRLQHFRYHEQQRHLVNTTNKTWRFTQQQLTNDGLIRRKRGRPPKFPKDEIPVVPKPEIEDDSTISDYSYSMEQFLSAENGVVRGYRLYKNGEACPDTYCPYHLARPHFHCLRPRCHHVSTNVEHELRLHAHDFHNYVHIMEGFEFFDRLVNCRRPNCQNSRANKHFHCVRPRCDYAFVRHSTMYQHDKKHNGDHEDANEGSNDGASMSHLSWDDKSKTVKAAGTYYPLSTLPKSIVQNLPVPSLSLPSFVPDFKQEAKSSLVSSLATSVAGGFASPFIMPPLLSLPGLIPMVGSPFQLLGSPHSNSLLSSSLTTSLATSLASSFAASSLVTSNSNAITLQQASAAAAALSGLAQQSSSSSKPPLQTPPPRPQAPPEVLDHWYSIRDKMHFKLDQNCGRPFCKLKKRDHYHCFDCNQAFSDPERLRAHVGRHGVKFEKPSKEESLDLSLNLNGEVFAAKLAASSRSQNSEDSRDSFTPNLEIDLEKSSDSLNSSLERSSLEDRKRGAEPLDDSLVVKHRRIATPRVNKDEPVPDGYVRYWAHEDCARRGCSYRQSTTHVHCLRETCMFGICSRPRIIQHTQRHARIDRIMGNEFVHYRANIQCHEEDCTYSEKSSHFHCRKCPFTAQDTIKVTAHRKYHSKNDFFVSQGFDKYTVSQNCLIKECKYAMRNTHYHCLFPGCFASVIGQSQMAPHRLKHAGFQERFASPSTGTGTGSCTGTGTGMTQSNLFGSNSMVFPSMVERSRNSDVFPGTGENDETHSNLSSPSNSGPTPCPPQLLAGTVFDTR